jgi:hypothetical protein
MSSVPPRPFVALTLTVALATLCALGLPDGLGGRDSVVRLTRGGLQRLGYADTASCHEYPESLVESARDPLPDADRIDGGPVAAVRPASAALPAPAVSVAGPARFACRPPAPAPPGHAVSGRAPPER